MKVEHITIYYPRAMHGDGGVTNVLWLWVESLHRAGVDVEILYDARLPVSVQRAVPDGVHSRAIPHRGRGRRTRPIRFHKQLEPSTLLILHSGYTAFNLIAGRAAKDRGTPYVVVPQGAYDPQVRGRGRAIRSVWEIAERRLLEQAAAVHVFFQPEVGHVHQLARDACTVTAAPAFDLPTEAWSPGAGDYVAWLGRYDVRHKGLDRLLDAMVLLPSSGRPSLRLRGRDHRETRHAVQELVDARGLTNDVSVEGPIDGLEKQQFLRNARAYVHPSRWESYGVALVENLALGVPCLTTTDVNLGADLTHNDAACVVRPDASGLAEGLAAVAADLLVPYGERGRAFVRDLLSHKVAAEQFLGQMDALHRVRTP
jgi:glycosyltransferase involved in cell wall biosynthesis